MYIFSIRWQLDTNAHDHESIAWLQLASLLPSMSPVETGLLSPVTASMIKSWEGTLRTVWVSSYGERWRLFVLTRLIQSFGESHMYSVHSHGMISWTRCNSMHQYFLDCWQSAQGREKEKKAAWRRARLLFVCALLSYAIFITLAWA